MTLTLSASLAYFFGFMALLFALICLFGPAYIYHRGLSRSSPIPHIKFVSDKPAEAPKPKPPTQKCRNCNLQDWKLTPDESLWECGNCAHTILGPKPRIRS